MEETTFDLKKGFEELAIEVKADTTMPPSQKFQMLLEIYRTIAHIEEQERYITG